MRFGKISLYLIVFLIFFVVQPGCRTKMPLETGPEQETKPGPAVPTPAPEQESAKPESESKKISKVPAVPPILETLPESVVEMPEKNPEKGEMGIEAKSN